jgi:hypothetical protein
MPVMDAGVEACVGLGFGVGDGVGAALGEAGAMFLFD